MPAWGPCGSSARATGAPAHLELLLRPEIADRGVLDALSGDGDQLLRAVLRASQAPQHLQCSRVLTSRPLPGFSPVPADSEALVSAPGPAGRALTVGLGIREV